MRVEDEVDEIYLDDYLSIYVTHIIVNLCCSVVGDQFLTNATKFLSFQERTVRSARHILSRFGLASPPHPASWSKISYSI